MATARTIRNTCWKVAGFPTFSALEKALAELRVVGLLRPSVRGPGANHLDAQELAIVTIVLRGHGDAADTAAFAALTRDADPGGQRLADRIAGLIEDGAARILRGDDPRPARLILGKSKGVWARLELTNTRELFRDNADESENYVQRVVYIPPPIWQAICEMAADSASRTKTKSLPSDHQGNVPGEATKKRNARQAANLTGVGCLSSKTQPGDTQRQPSIADGFSKRLVGITSRRATGDPVRNHIERVPHGQKTQVACRE